MVSVLKSMQAHHIIYPKHHEDVKALLDQYHRSGTLKDHINDLLYRESEQYTALVWAITQHHKEMVRALLDYGASIEQPGDENNWNALHYAAAWGNPDMIKMLFDHVETLEHKVDLLEQRDNETHETPHDMLDNQSKSYQRKQSLQF